MRNYADFYNQGHLTEELVKEHPVIAIFGCFQNGKSTLVNCLLNKYKALTGKGLATTSLVARYRYGNTSKLNYRNKNGTLNQTTLDMLHNDEFVKRNVRMTGGFHIEATAHSSILKSCDIVDTPGFDANQMDTIRALSIVGDVHYALFVIPNRAFTQAEKGIIAELNKNKIPFSVLMNCSIGRREEKWIPSHNINNEIAQENESWLASLGYIPILIFGKTVYPCNFLFYWSQQTEFDLSKTFIDRPDRVLPHIYGLFQEEGIPITPESIQKISKVPHIIRHLEQMISRYDAVSQSWK